MTHLDALTSGTSRSPQRDSDQHDISHKLEEEALSGDPAKIAEKCLLKDCLRSFGHPLYLNSFRTTSRFVRVTPSVNTPPRPMLITVKDTTFYVSEGKGEKLKKWKK